MYASVLKWEYEVLGDGMRESELTATFAGGQGEIV